MGVERYLYDVTIYTYALSVLMYFSDFLQPNHRMNRAALGLLVVVWLSLATVLVLRLLERQFVPFFTTFDSLIFYAWAIVSFSMVINTFYRMDLFVFLANLVGFALAALSLFVRHDVPPSFSERLLSELLVIHVTFALVAYAFFLLSLLLALLYLLLNDMLKNKQWNKLVKRAPSLSQLEHLTYCVSMIGVPIYMLSLILGLIWAQKQAVHGFWYDPKVWLSFFALTVYIYYLYQRKSKHWSGRWLAYCNAFAFTIILFNLIISNSGHSFHRW
ncbi:cytochrome c biogenesis protein CcsA [Numidum massiliense]|uniref:cytochrome c biogenesis protein CcsA n=1 Tax=Numidum massiliense TaxID=1522315 RepID=UPI0006D5449F|nr:cytochrome c biogenesis protein CcsA [Numidum massiliense]